MRQASILFFAFILSFGLWAGNSQFPPPTNLITSNINYNEATLKWTNNPNAFLWIIAYNVSQNPVINYSISNNDSLELNYLISGATYNWKIAMIDIYGDTTNWSEIITFKTLQPISSCPGVTQIQIENMTSSGINVQWVAEMGSSLWEVSCGPLGSNPEYDGARYTSKNNNFLIPNLIPSYWYQIAVRSVCTAGNSPWIFINTKYIPNQSYILPVQQTFEDISQNSNFGFINGNINPWLIGSSYNSTTDGKNSVYVSTTSGLTNQYYPNESTISYSYIDVFIPSYATSFYLDFKWKGLGEASSDGLKVYLMEPNSTLDINQLPQVSSQIGKTIYNNNDSIWNLEHIEIPAQYVGQVRRLVFAWINDSIGGGGSSIILDDIYITARYCATPKNLSTGYTSFSSCELDWDFAYNQNLFNLQYRKLNETNWTQIDSVSPVYTLVNLDDNTDYIFRVQADCMMEESFWSEPDTFKTNLLCLPPENIILDSYTDKNAVISWNIGGNISKWIFEYGLDNNQNIKYNKLESFNNISTLNNLSPNTIYNVRIRAISLQGDTSQYSKIFRFRTLCQDINQFPYTSLLDSIYWISDSSFNYIPDCWRLTSDTSLLSPYFDFSSLGFPELGLDYRYNDKSSLTSKASIYASLDGVNFFSIMQINQAVSDSGNIKIEMPQFSNLNRIRLAIIIEPQPNSNIEFSVKNFIIKDICKTPQDLVIDEITTNSARLDFTGYSNNQSWDITLKNLSNNDSIIQRIQTHPYKLSNLRSSSNYKLRIRSICAVGLDSANWREVDFSTLSESDICPMPKNFTGKSIQNPDNLENSILLSWDNSIHNQWILDYKNKYAIQWLSERIIGKNNFVLRDLPLGQEYVFKLRTLCSQGDTSLWTDTKSIIVGQSSIEDLDILSSIRVYPNPVYNILNIDNPMNYKFERITLVNNNGVILRTWTNSPKQIDLREYPEGNYYLNLKTNQYHKTIKLIIGR